MSIFSKIGKAVGDAREELEGVRQKITDRKTERATISKTPMDKAATIGQIGELVAASAAAFDRDIAIGYLARPCHDLSIAFELAVRNSPLGYDAWLKPDDLRERITQKMHQFWEQNPPGLSSSERRQRIAALDAEILELEIKEEQIITAAAEHGIDLERRGDADPRAVIGTPE